MCDFPQNMIKSLGKKEGELAGFREQLQQANLALKRSEEALEVWLAVWSLSPVLQEFVVVDVEDASVVCFIGVGGGGGQWKGWGGGMSTGGTAGRLVSAAKTCLLFSVEFIIVDVEYASVACFMGWVGEGAVGGGGGGGGGESLVGWSGVCFAGWSDGGDKENWAGWSDEGMRRTGLVGLGGYGWVGGDENWAS